MPVYEFNSQEEMDEHAELVEEINFKHLELKEVVNDAKKDLSWAEENLLNFENDNKEYLVG